MGDSKHFCVKKDWAWEVTSLTSENINNTISEVERDVNFVLRFLDLEVKLSVGCNDEE